MREAGHNPGRMKATEAGKAARLKGCIEMTKPELVTAILEETTGYKKTHLMEKHKEELEAIYAQINGANIAASGTDVIADDPIEAAEPQDMPAPVEKEATEKTSDTRRRRGASELGEYEKLMLSTIPLLADFSGVDSEMSAFAFVKKAEEMHGITISKARALFASLRDKGYYIAKGKAAGQTRTTFQLSKRGIQFLTDNDLLAVA